MGDLYAGEFLDRLDGVGGAVIELAVDLLGGAHERDDHRVARNRNEGDPAVVGIHAREHDDVGARNAIPRARVRTEDERVESVVFLLVALGGRRIEDLLELFFALSVKLHGAVHAVDPQHKAARHDGDGRDKRKEDLGGKRDLLDLVAMANELFLLLGGFAAGPLLGAVEPGAEVAAPLQLRLQVGLESALEAIARDLAPLDGRNGGRRRGTLEIFSLRRLFAHGIRRVALEDLAIGARALGCICRRSEVRALALLLILVVVVQCKSTESKGRSPGQQIVTAVQDTTRRMRLFLAVYPPL